MRLFLAALMLVLAAAPAVADPPKVRAGSYDYGGNRRQVVDIVVPRGVRKVPLILFIHGGGWSEGSRSMAGKGQAAHFTAKGFAWAKLNYRLVPDFKVEDQAADIAAALAFLTRNARALGIDPAKVILIGHSSGAQLAALVATDPQWLARAKLPFEAIRGVVSLDGAGIDVPGSMAAGAASVHFYANAFGQDVARQTRLSPFAHLGEPDAPHWLFLFDAEHNAAAGFFAERFAAVARVRDLNVTVHGLRGTTHMRMLQDLGKQSDPVTELVDRFIDTALAAKNQ